MAETLDIIASCRAAVVAELGKTHSPRDIRFYQREIERLDAHPLITGLHKGIYQAIENAEEGFTTEALCERFGGRALAALQDLKQNWIRLEPNGTWVKILPELPTDPHPSHISTNFTCPL